MTDFTPNATVDGEPVQARYVERPDYYGPGEYIPAEAYEYATMFHCTYEDGEHEYVSEDEIHFPDDEDD